VKLFQCMHSAEIIFSCNLHLGHLLCHLFAITQWNISITFSWHKIFYCCVNFTCQKSRNFWTGYSQHTVYLVLLNTYFYMVHLNVIKIFKSFKILNTFKFSPKYKLHVKNLEVKTTYKTQVQIENKLYKN
jgi:hypothetical protein